MRRFLRTTAVVLAAGVLAAIFGLTTAQFTGSLGPHIAQYSTTVNSEVTIDMGPLGSFIIDSPLPIIGVHVLVREIPDALASDAINPIAGLTADLASYSQFFTSPETAVDAAMQGLTRDAIGRSVLAWTILLVLIAWGRLASHGVLRKAIYSAWRRQGVPALTVTLLFALAVPTGYALTRGSEGAGRTSQVLADTPLEDARITGRLVSLVDFYGGYVIDAIATNDDFYAEVDANLYQAYAEADDPIAPSGDPPVLPLIEPEPEAGDPAQAEADSDGVDPVEPASVEPDSASSPSPATQTTSTPDPARPPDPVTMVIVSDLHCNVGMAAVIGSVVELAEAEMVLNAGDTVMAGTSVESFCVDAFADGIGDTPVVMANGNHDSQTTAAQAADRGWLVLRGEPVEVAGVRILGDTDPRLSSLGAPTSAQRGETIDAMGQRLAAVACGARADADILLIHNPRAATATLESGCLPLTVSGHMHRQIGPWQRGTGIEFVSSSTAGAAQASPTIGPLQAPATITVMRWDRANRLPLDYRTITVEVDRSVHLGSWWAVPPAADEPVDLPVPDVGQAPWDTGS
ncbi:MAG: metallophosphoesterase [Beutenbergiaceae bacterium]